MTLKKKWTRLKSRYRKELKRISTPLSSDDADDSKVQWKYFKYLSFLRCETIPGVDGSSLEVKVEDTPSEDVKIINYTQKPPPSRSTSSATLKPAETHEELRSEYLEIQKRELRQMELELAKNMNSESERESIRELEDYYFLLSILPHIERLPQLQKIRLRNKINLALQEEMASPR